MEEELAQAGGKKVGKKHKHRRGPRVLKNMSTPRLLFLATGRDWETLIPLKLSRPRS